MNERMHKSKASWISVTGNKCRTRVSVRGPDDGILQQDQKDAAWHQDMGANHHPYLPLQLGKERQRQEQRQPPHMEKKKKLALYRGQHQNQRPQPRSPTRRALLLTAAAAGALAGTLAAAATTAVTEWIYQRRSSLAFLRRLFMLPRQQVVHTAFKSLNLRTRAGSGRLYLPPGANDGGGDGVGPLCHRTLHDRRPLFERLMSQSDVCGLTAAAPQGSSSREHRASETESSMALWPLSPPRPVVKLPPLSSRTPLPAASATRTTVGHGPAVNSPGDIRHRVTTIVDSAIIRETDMPETMQGLALICTQALIDAGHEGFAEDLELAFNRWFQPSWHCEVVRHGREDDAPVISTRSSLEHCLVGTFVSFTLNGWSIAIYKDC